MKTSRAGAGGAGSVEGGLKTLGGTEGVSPVVSSGLKALRGGFWEKGVAAEKARGVMKGVLFWSSVKTVNYTGR